MKLSTSTMIRTFSFLCLLLPFATYSQTAYEHYEIAMDKLEAGATVSDVLLELEWCTRKDSTFEDAYFLRAFVYFKLEEFEEAIAEYDRLLKIKPMNMEALKRRALTKLQIYDIEGAIADHNLRLEFNPQNPVVYFDRAYCKGLMGDQKGAIADYTKAIEIDPNYRDALLNRGTAVLGFITNSTAPVEGVSIEDACDDLNRARMLGDSTAVKLMNEFCGK